MIMIFKNRTFCLIILCEKWKVQSCEKHLCLASVINKEIELLVQYLRVRSDQFCNYKRSFFVAEIQIQCSKTSKDLISNERTILLFDKMFRMISKLMHGEYSHTFSFYIISQSIKNLTDS